MAAQDDSAGDHIVIARQALERFVIENDDLLAIESRIGKFNIFDALGLTRTEIRHSNFLAFILDPAESHGQGQLFLKAILTDLLKNAPVHLRPVSPIELDGDDLRGVEVKWASKICQHLKLALTQYSRLLNMTCSLAIRPVTEMSQTA